MSKIFRFKANFACSDYSGKYNHQKSHNGSISLDCYPPLPPLRRIWNYLPPVAEPVQQSHGKVSNILKQCYVLWFGGCFVFPVPPELSIILFPHLWYSALVLPCKPQPGIRQQQNIHREDLKKIKMAATRVKSKQSYSFLFYLPVDISVIASVWFPLNVIQLPTLNA